MSQENKNNAACWFRNLWGDRWKPNIVHKLGAPDLLMHYPMHEPKRERAAVIEFVTELRGAFPDLNFWSVGDLIAEGDYVVGRWEGGGTRTGPAFSDFRMGSLPAASGRKMRFRRTTVLRLENGWIAEEIGQEDALTAMQQLGLLRAPEADVRPARTPLPPGWTHASFVRS